LEAITLHFPTPVNLFAGLDLMTLAEPGLAPEIQFAAM
jgi:hypothetical protein